MIEDVKSYYNNNADGEWDRLGNPYSNIEFNSTLYLIDKYFPKKGKILDIGSGPGRYSIELLKKDYSVSLLDLSDKELDIAKQKIDSLGLKADGYHANSALELDKFEDESFDSLLVLGPMYHLHDEADRKKVLDDSFRILKPGGRAIIAYINTWGVLKSAITETPELFDSEDKFDAYFQNSQKLSVDEGFTACYFANPVAAEKEIRNSKFTYISKAGAESFLAGMHLATIDLHKKNKEIYNLYVTKAAQYCEKPQFADTTEHLLFVVEKK